MMEGGGLGEKRKEAGDSGSSKLEMRDEQK